LHASLLDLVSFPFLVIDHECCIFLVLQLSFMMMLPF